MFPTTLKVQDVADYIKRTFGDESGVQVTDSDIIRWVNAAQIEIVDTNKFLKGTGTTPSVAGQESYTLTPGMKIMHIDSVYYDGKKLDFKSFHDAQEFLSSEDPNKEVQSIPEFWYSWATELNLYPIPDESGKTIKIYFLLYPDPVTSLSDTLSVPDNYFNRILEFALASAYEMDENFAAHQAKMGQFQDSLLNMSLNEEQIQVDTYSTITILPEDY